MNHCVSYDENLKAVAPVSVVIPCYCSAGTIEKAVDSIYVQTVRPAEVIIVDDASPDGTFEVLQSLQARYPAGWIKIKQLIVNSGPSTARNTGWDLASFPYIAFLDADDSWHPNKIEIQYTWMAGRPDVALTGHLSVIAGEEPVIGFDELMCVPRRIGMYALLLSNQFSTPSVMIRRDIPFRFIPGQHYCEDYMLWCSIIVAGLSVYKFDCPLAYLYKPRYGCSGLSSNLWQMEIGELRNYIGLYRQNAYSLLLLVALIFISIIKYLKRVVLAQFMNKTSS